MAGTLKVRVGNEWVEVGGPGPPGPPGEGGTSNYRHVQTTPATTWTIVHNLAFQPNIAVIDSNNREIWPGEVQHLDGVTVQLTFSAAVGGEAYLS
jgi:hypothetical protein